MVRMRFDKDAKFALTASIGAAMEFCHNYVGSEHLVLGLLNTVPELFAGQVTADGVRDRIYEVVGRPQQCHRPKDHRMPPYTDGAKRCLGLAIEAATRRGAHTVSARDLLDGIRRDGGGIGAQVLSDLGLGGSAAAPFDEPLSGCPEPETLVQLSDESQQPFYDQIVAQIKEAIAAGQLIPGDRLPPIRRLADALDLAPGTVARAYKQLEEEGVVQTDGARGTTVGWRRPPAAGSEEHRVTELVGLLRPVAVAAFHMGAAAGDLFSALDVAIQGVFKEPPERSTDSS